jgi:hypothetical protein
MELLRIGVAAFEERDQTTLTDGARGDELRELAVLRDRIEVAFSRSARAFQACNGHLIDGASSAAGWISRNCKMSVSSAADRLCVGKELESPSVVADAVVSGQLGYQTTSALCHLTEQLGEKRDRIDETKLVEWARDLRVAQVRELCRRVRHAVDPEGFDRAVEEDFERRWLHVSPMLDGMFAIDGVLDQVGGAAVRTALDALCAPRGDEDHRSAGQRQADALVELTHHALDNGTLPKRRGVRPHVSVTTTLEGLKNELGAPAVDLELSVPISTKSLERICCDATISRVLLADSQVIDVGRATRVVSAPTRRAVRARDKRCRFTGCDRAVSWTTPHHILHWTRHRGPTNPHNLVSLCHFHNRLVHEGGWQVIAKGKELRFLPPEQRDFRRVRGPGKRWAA